MPPALIGGVIAGGAALLSSSKNSKAINKATDAQTKSDADQIAFQRQAYAQNTANLTPWMTSGLAANSLINSALGIPMAPQAMQPQGALTVPYNGGYPDAAQYPGYHGGALQGFNPYQQGVIGEGGIYGAPYQGWHGGPNQPGMMSVASAPTDPAAAATNAYELFKQSTGYQTRFSEGMRALNAGFAGRGVLQSGAAVKSALRFGQNFASNEFGNWLGQVGNQQGLGFAGASALAGVSQGNADRMGAISQNSAQFAGQAAVARAQNSGALFSGLAGIAGNAFGALSSYR